MSNLAASVRVAITMSDGSLGIMEFLTVARAFGDVLPEGAEWVEDNDQSIFVQAFFALFPGLRSRYRWWKREPTPENIGKEVLKATFIHEATPVNHKIIDFNDIPQDRTFRDGWKLEGTKVVHDMPRCRAIHLEHLKQERALKFVQLDADYTKALSQKDKTKQEKLEVEMQALRDMPTTKQPEIDAAQTVEELKAIAL